MKGGEAKVKQPEPETAGLSHDEIVSSTEAKCIPWFCGEARIALTWITPVLNQFTKPLPVSGKKDK